MVLILGSWVVGPWYRLGRGYDEALAKEGVNLAINSPNVEVLENTADALRALNPAIQVYPVTGYIGREVLLAACPPGRYSYKNNSGPPPGDFREGDRKTWK